MIKKWIYYIAVILIVTFISFGFKPAQEEDQAWFLIDEDQEMLYHFPSPHQTDYVNHNIPYTGKFFIGYKEALAFKESQGKYSKINTHGYLGKYQFGTQTLRSIGIYDSNAFMRSPKLQEKAFIALISKNKGLLQNEIKKYSGKVINGIYITESGILAAAHLGGVGSVKKFFRSKGKRFPRDKYGTSIRSYMKKFSGYETSAVPANPKATIANI